MQSIGDLITINLQNRRADVARYDDDDDDDDDDVWVWIILWRQNHVNVHNG